MNFDLLADLPPYATLLIFVGVSVGLVLLISWIFYDSFVAMAQPNPEPEASESSDSASHKPVVPSTYDLWQRLLAFTTLAFVFMLAFVLNTFWGNVQAAQDASQSEASHVARLSSLARNIPDQTSAEAVQKAINAYADSVSTQQWPLLRVADRTGASEEAFASSNALAEVIIRAQAADTTNSPIWGNISSTLSDLGQDSSDRLGQLPAGSAPSRVGIVIVLGVAMLLMTTAFLPTRVRPYRISISIMAALTSLLIFVMVEASNPYAHHVTPPESLTQMSGSTG